MSAAVDGVYAGFSLAKQLGLFHGSIDAVLGKDQKNAGFLKYWFSFFRNGNIIIKKVRNYKSHQLP